MPRTAENDRCEPTRSCRPSQGDDPLEPPAKAGVQQNAGMPRVPAVDTVAAPAIPVMEPVAGTADLPDGASVQENTEVDFDVWAAERGRSLLVFATAVTGDREAARDAVQDALVAVYLRWRRLVAGGEPDAYARRVIVNRHISWWRRLGRRERLTAFDHHFGPAADAAQDRLADTDMARRLLAGLPARQRAAVALRFYDDLAFAEIATILDCPESTARSYVHRALKLLRAQLEADGDD
jgi:RNA polymerase sigma-70 factor (sigma-E family)